MTANALTCARCGTPMLYLQLGAGFAHACNTCGAVFLAPVHAVRVRSGVDRTAPMLAERGAKNRPIVDVQRDTAPLMCPACGIAMQPEWVREKQLRLDHCAAHGTFFDAHELAAMVPPPARPVPVFRPGVSNLAGQPFGDQMLEFLAQVLTGGG